MVVALSQSTTDGLSEDARKSLQQCRDCANQILRVALAINGSVLAEMDPQCLLGYLAQSTGFYFYAD